MATVKLVDLEVILSISFEQEYLEGFKLILTTYKKTNDEIKDSINSEGKALKDNYIEDKVDINLENNCFVTLNDHKDNFVNNPTTRL